MINAAWNVFEVAFVACFWIETKDMTLEQIDEKLLALYGKIRYVDGIEGAEVKGSIVQTVKMGEKE